MPKQQVVSSTVIDRPQNPVAVRPQVDTIYAVRQKALDMQGMVARTAQQMAAFEESYMGPGYPLTTLRAGYPPRSTDYPTTFNMQVTHEKNVAVLTALANWDVARYCIEKRKNGVRMALWEIGPVEPEANDAGQFNAAIEEMTDYWSMPDRQNGQTLDLWTSALMEDSFRFDAACFFRWPTDGWLARHTNDWEHGTGYPQGKDIACHRAIDGRYIIPKIDSRGNRPLPPSPAYQQMVKGYPLTEYTSDQLVYLVRNPRNDSPYGMSEIEWLILNINIALRLDTSDLLHWTAGQVPYGFGETPKEWTPDQIKRWSDVWQEMLHGDLARKTEIIWGPAGMNFHEFQNRDKQSENYKFYEWLARRACAIFGVPSSPYTSQLSRAGAELNDELAGEGAEEPLKQWLATAITTEIQTVQGQSELCFRYVSEKKTDELEQAEANNKKVYSGMCSLDDVLVETGRDPIGIPNFIILPGQSEPFYLRGQDEAYLKKYKKFFDDRDAKEAEGKALAAQIAGGNGAQPKPREQQVMGTPGEGGKQAPGTPPAPGEKQAPPQPGEKPLKAAVLDDLAKWRKVARRCLKEGKAQKAFESDAIPAWAMTEIENGLTTCDTLEKVDALFTDCFAQDLGQAIGLDKASPIVAQGAGRENAPETATERINDSLGEGVAKGDVPGHEFHGNQWVSSAGYRQTEGERYKTTSHFSKKDAVQQAREAREHGHTVAVWRIKHPAGVYTQPIGLGRGTEGRDAWTNFEVRHKDPDKSVDADLEKGITIIADPFVLKSRARRPAGLERIRERYERRIAALMARLFRAQAERAIKHVKEQVTEGAAKVAKGGTGSGNFGHAGREGEVGGSGEGGTSAAEMRSLRAKGSYKPATAEKQRIAEANEVKLAKAIGGKSLPDNEPFDVLHEKHAIEVKTIIDGKNPKITMHADSLARKVAFARANKVKAWTVAIDQRETPPVAYLRRGVGSFNLYKMERVGSLQQLKLRF